MTSACAAGSALEAQKGTDISSITPGIARSNVERIVGTPNREWMTSATVHYCIYQYVGDASPNAGKAAWIFGLDLATLGILEFASPQWSQLGASDRRPRRFVAVAYDQGDQVIGVFPDATEFSELPADGYSSNVTKTRPTVAPVTTSVVSQGGGPGRCRRPENSRAQLRDWLGRAVGRCAGAHVAYPSCDPGYANSAFYRDLKASRMTPSQIEKAQALAAAWKPTAGQ